MKSYTITENDAGQRLDKFLTKAVPRLPQSQLYKYLRIKRVKCNHKRCEPSYNCRSETSWSCISMTIILMNPTLLSPF